MWEVWSGSLQRPLRVGGSGGGGGGGAEVGLASQPLDARLPHWVKDESPWQSNDLIVV